jgi:TonB family protein
MFEATLYTADLDRSRLQRLTLAAAIAIAATTAGIASMWTLDQLHIDRISGPSQQFELAQLSMLPPPPPVVPPPPPEDDTEDQKPADPVSSEREQVESSDADDSIDAEDSPSEIPEPRTIAAPRKQGIPDLGQSGCPGGVCQGVAKTGPDGGSPCLGPLCGNRSTSPTIESGPPKEVEFSALRCLACADPDRAALRKTTASVQGREGKVTARFCVDAGGRVEANSISIERSYGDAAVDRIVRATIKGWRFSPMKVGNQARRACSSVSFNIRFD